MGFVYESQNFLSHMTNSSLILNQGHLFICVVNIQYYILWNNVFTSFVHIKDVLAFSKYIKGSNAFSVQSLFFFMDYLIF